MEHNRYKEEAKENTNLDNRRLTLGKLDAFQKPPRENSERHRVAREIEKSPESGHKRSTMVTPPYTEREPQPEHSAVREFVRNIADENDKLHMQQKKWLSTQNDKLAMNHALMSIEVLRLNGVVKHFEDNIRLLNSEVDALERGLQSKGIRIVKKMRKYCNRKMNWPEGMMILLIYRKSSSS